ncbi:hypothetical protein N2152v2_009795 [Parachlorella kessleri]
MNGNKRYFARHEHSVPHLLCCSDSQPLQLSELLELADEDSRQRWESLSLAYTEAQGLPALREAIAACPALYTTISPDDLIIAAPEEAIYLAMLALLKPGDRIIATYPGYQSLHEIARSLGCSVSLWELESAGPQGSLAFDVGRLESLLEEGPPAKLVVVNFPHNPTGWLPDGKQWQRLVEACRRAGSYLFSDEMYRGMEFDPATRLAPAADMYERGVSLCGMSKAVGGPGLRIGWLATHATEVLDRVKELKDYTTICNSAPSEILALVGVRSWDKLVDRQMAMIRSNLALVESFFQRWRQVLEWEPPLAGTIAFPRLLTGEPVEAFCDRLVEEAGVLLLPATVYDHALSIEQGRFRLGFGRRNLPDCLKRLEAFLAKGHPECLE